MDTSIFFGLYNKIRNDELWKLDFSISHCLKLFELFLGGGAFGDFDDVEADSFGKRPAFADRHNVALQMGGEIREKHELT